VGIAAAAAAAAASPHALLTVSHDVPVRRPFAFALPRRFPPIALVKSIRITLRGRTWHKLSARMSKRLRSLSR
jgi:hypothetical protein